jgi:hypothetical protein
MSIRVPKFDVSGKAEEAEARNSNDVKLELKEQIINSFSLPVLILHTRDLEEEESSILKSFGNTILYDEKKYAGIPIEIIISKLEPHYIVLDLRNKAHKSFFLQISNKDVYKKIGLLCKAEKYHTFFAEIKQVVDNVIFKLPNNVAFKDQFDAMLLSQSISVPGFFSTGLGCCLNFLDSFKINQDH